MNDLMTPVRSLDRDEHLALLRRSFDDSRISVVDRLSLRLGLWLLTRGTRERTDHAGRRPPVDRELPSIGERERSSAYSGLTRPWFL